MKDKRLKESTRRFWMDRDGTIWINVRSVRRKPLTDKEIAQMNKLVDEKEARGDDSLN